MPDHEGISSAAELGQMISVVSENLADEEAMLPICLRQVLNPHRQSSFDSVELCPRSTNQVKEPVCRE